MSYTAASGNVGAAFAAAGVAAPAANPRREAGRPTAPTVGPVPLASASVAGQVIAKPVGESRPVAAAPPVASLSAPAGMSEPVAAPAALAAAAPRKRPGERAVQAAPKPDRVATLNSLLRPVPRPRDVKVAKPAPDAKVEQVAFVAPVQPDVLTSRKGALCGVPSIKGRQVAPVASRVKGCGIANAVEVTAVDGVTLSQPATIDCGTAVALDRWVKTGLKRAVGGQGGGVARINIAGSYTCRPMNNVRGAKISEHGRGRAIDISGIVLKDGTTASVARDWRKRDTGPMLKAAYRAGCGIFGTTLGPGSDGYHEDHLHFDTARHRNGSYCR